ncbi:MAG: response regulator [SAR324 cluster bacterium]|uniref:Response regulator n=1 Tax=SAR324 cluster bacterium TaxID=2024889 RepID=A0A2A4SUI4_9DELT|nr:MAG: response regulator [SAR324 cluster bacterium]
MATILIVDDDEQFRNMLQQMLQRSGHHVETAVNGNQGIQVYRKTPTDLVIMDLLMPEKEGLESIVELKTEFNDIKVIAISGGGQKISAQPNLEIAKILGAIQTLHKPFSRQEILETVNQVLR